jgi:NADPH:quinone reductase
MQAIVVDALGGPEVLRLRDQPIPNPGPGQVLVRVHVVGVNFSDTERRRGTYDPPTLPYIPGKEAAGVVEAVGPSVDPSWRGRRVSFWAMDTSGAYAQFTVAPVGALFHLRDELTFEQGATLPAQGLTAYALAEVATSLRPGQSALVHAAAGGVGQLLVQLLRRRGVRVLGTASSAAKQALVRTLGAEAFGYGPHLSDQVRAATDGRGVDAVFDSIGQSTRAVSLAVLAPHGHLVYFGEASGAPAPIDLEELYGRSLHVSAFWLATDPLERWHQARHDLQEWVTAGSLHLAIEGTYPLAQAAQAHRALESRQTSGKLLLQPAP